MDFLTALNSTPYFVYDGPMETRIEYGTNLQLDDEMSIFTLVTKDEGREALRKLYNEDITIASRYQLPIIINAPTYRANPAHLNRLGYGIQDISKINADCLQFVAEIRENRQEYKEHIYLTAPIGPRLAGYKPDYALDLANMVRFYALQADALANSPVDIISIAAMPSLVEAKGSAIAVANTNLPYSVGLILTPEGTLLDGTSLEKAIDKIDNSTKIIPNFYVISCTHPEVAARGLSKLHGRVERIKGIKANGSSKSPKELLQLDHAEADNPTSFAKEVVSLGKQYHFKVYGGCCGTDARHLEAIAKELSRKDK